MILRGLARNLREQNWTAILVEFVLLVAGVFLGIQAANWNEQRAEDAKAQAYLARIREDLDELLETAGSDAERQQRLAALGALPWVFTVITLVFAGLGYAVQRKVVPRGRD